ncbi:hypothetical protein [Enterobacter kobei]|uniref:hypothetical protein n=2 Tax=Enterobacter kobei TaxID=208224 RepID=UPI0015D4BCC9|nr:hypothetical protein [Enterobacter kobei]
MGFNGIITETTCSLTLSENTSDLPNIPSRMIVVMLSLKQCPENMLSGATVSLRETAGKSAYPEFSYDTGDRVNKGDVLELFRFKRKSPLEVGLPLHVLIPSAEGSSSYGAVMHLIYD